MPAEPKRRCVIFWNYKLQRVVSGHVDAGSQTKVLYKSRCPWSLRHLSSLVNRASFPLCFPFLLLSFLPSFSPSFLKDLDLFSFHFVCVCTSMSLCAPCVCRFLWRPEGISSKTGVIGGCELPCSCRTFAGATGFPKEHFFKLHYTTILETTHCHKFKRLFTPKLICLPLLTGV